MQDTFVDYQNYSTQNPQKLKFHWEKEKPTQYVRPDERSYTTSRPVSIDKGTLSRSDGSVLLKIGETHVLASVNGPLSTDSSKEKYDKSVIDVSVKFRHTPTNGSLVSRET